MEIRKATAADLPALDAAFAAARAFMRATGNLHQWTNGEPSATRLAQDIAAGCSYVCCDDAGEILGSFFFKQGDDPTYKMIEQGAWPNSEPYAVMHRVAVTRHGAGVAAFCFAWCLAHCRNLRIDTHRDNLPMQRALAKNGFAYCGIIHLANGDERLAYAQRGAEQA